MSRNTWDRDRFMYERERDRDGHERIRYEEDDRYYRAPASSSRHRDLSVDDRYERRSTRAHDDEIVVRDSRRVYYDDEPRYHSRHRSPSPELERDSRRVVIERERVRSPSPNRPAFLRRQSSLDTFDRRPRGYPVEEERYGPPARIPREEFRPRPYEPIPLPRSRGLPPPRRYADHEYYDEIRVSDPDHYGDDEFRAYPERVHEREIIRTKRRDASPSAKSAKSVKSAKSGKSSRTGRSQSHHASTVRSSSSGTSSSSGSSSGGTTVTVKSEYPKKGKTRIPGRLVSKRALIDLGYPYTEEGNTVVVLKALGQENIDDLLKLSEDYKKSELEMPGAFPHDAGDFFEERRETIIESHAPPPPPPVQALPPPPPPASVHHPPPPSVHHPPPPSVHHPPPPSVHHPPPPSVHHAPPPSVHPPPPIFMQPPPPPPAPATEVYEKRTIIRDVSPARSYTTTHSGTTHTSATPYIIDTRREVSEEVPVGALALVRSSGGRSRSRSRSRSHRELRSEIKDLARRNGEREIIKAERLSSGELVLYEEQIERIEEPRRGVRIEKDKKGRMSISVPKYR